MNLAKGAPAEPAPLAEGRLEWLAAIRFGGPDARQFLQGQFTNDVFLLDGGGWQYSGLCNPKGRLIASFALRREGEGEYVALLERKIAADFCAHLSKYVLRAKVKIEAQLGRGLRCVAAGSSGGGETEFAGIGGTSLVLEAVAHPDAPGQRDARRGIADEDWMRDQIAGGIPWIGARTRDLFVAQSINFDLLGGVSFSKGCFVGQEIIARLHYRGTPKQRMYRAEGEGEPPLEAAALYCGKYGAQAAGHVVNAARAPGGFVALACARADAAAEAFSLRPDEAGALRLAEISY